MKLFAILMVAVVATFAGYNLYQSQRMETMSDLMLANVEALADNESADDYDRVDKITTDYTDPKTGKKRTVITIVCDGSGLLSCE
ncbi:NVEALA domain-containing protein [Bacteroides sp. GD17]|jgi:hypothetical protein|uniref:NVEALA domain-containing protein n=1 Tax=Bacteroides sp. GD17 TaxID=3139826 RepID=UPI00260086F4|nr:NVEALA domain-containing protein [uncultured Bacteroides sp.]